MLYGLFFRIAHEMGRSLAGLRYERTVPIQIGISLESLQVQHHSVYKGFGISGTVGVEIDQRVVATVQAIA